MNTGRSIASVIMWITYLAMVWMSVETMEGWAILMAFVLMMPLMGAMGMMWSMGGSRSEKNVERKQAKAEKRKRERLDAVLRDLSDEDLLRLKQRLEYGLIDDDVLYDNMVGDDGELVDGY